MILHRIASALRNQNWATVFIEFILIFASVLLALQFNNWNSDRIIKSQEREILEALVEDLVANIESFDVNIQFDVGSIAACDHVLAVMQAGNDWDDDVALAMGYCRGWTSPYLKSFAYQSLQAIGVDLISNRQLRRTISELYETEYSYLVGDTDRTFWEFQHTVMLPAFARYLLIPPHGEDKDWASRHMFPQDYEVLKGSLEFKTVLLAKRSYQTLSIRDQKKVSEHTNGVLQSIKAELAGEGSDR